MLHTEPLRVFWQPGCSSCVRVKEFLTGLGVPFESVNVLGNPHGLADLETLGARSVPVVSKGRDFVFAQSLDEVAKFVGKDVRFQPLPPAELIDRWLHVLDVSMSLVTVIPPQLLEHRPIPDRDRSVRALGYHIFQVPDAFLQAVEHGASDLRPIHEQPPPNVKTTVDVLEYAERITRGLKAWWDNLDDKSCTWTVKTYYGVPPAHQFLERSTWHSAQHARQLTSVLDGFHVALDRRIDEAAYRGLPMPQSLWE
jgi:glutaredoxin